MTEYIGWARARREVETKHEATDDKSGLRKYLGSNSLKRREELQLLREQQRQQHQGGQWQEEEQELVQDSGSVNNFVYAQVVDSEIINESNNSNQDETITKEREEMAKHVPLAATLYESKHTVKGGRLSADSIGANVHIVWGKISYTHLHFAAIHVPWSCVEEIRDAAQDVALGDVHRKQKNKELGEIMVVDLHQLRDRRSGKNLFSEDFENVFGHVFISYFVPLLDSKFNGKGEIAQDLLPADVSEGFILLVLCERLNALLKEDVSFHLNQLLLNGGEQACFDLLNTSISFELPAHEESYQKAVTEEAITMLVNQIPNSLASLEALIENCTKKGKGNLAVRLFRRSTMFALEQSNREGDKCRQQADEYMNCLKDHLETVSRRKNQYEIVSNLLSTASSSMKSSIEETFCKHEEAVVGAGFKQGIVLHKIGMGSSGGPRIVQCMNDVLLWRKPGKRESGKSTKFPKTDIVAISVVDNDSSKLTFRISGTKQGTITFRTESEHVRNQCVEALKLWWRPDQAHNDRRRKLREENDSTQQNITTNEPEDCKKGKSTREEISQYEEEEEEDDEDCESYYERRESTATLPSSKRNINNNEQHADDCDVLLEEEEEGEHEEFRNPIRTNLLPPPPPLQQQQQHLPKHHQIRSFKQRRDLSSSPSPSKFSPFKSLLGRKQHSSKQKQQTVVGDNQISSFNGKSHML